MNAYVEKIELPINEEVLMNMYKVVYCYMYGNGYDSGNRWCDFGVYEREEVANAVANGINSGKIDPIRR